MAKTERSTSTSGQADPGAEAAADAAADAGQGPAVGSGATAETIQVGEGEPGETAAKGATAKGSKRAEGALDVEPGTGPARTPKAATGKDVEVELSQHWTDPDGTNHVPGSTVTVSEDQADSLRASGYAKPEAPDAPYVEPEGGEYVRNAAPAAAEDDSEK